MSPELYALLTQIVAPFAIMIAIFYFLLIRPQKKRDQQQREMLAALKVGDKVVSIGGIVGRIQNIKDDIITIEVGADKTKIPFERSAIRNVVTD